AQGITVDGVRYEPIEAALERVQGSNAWLSVMLREGKNREIRKVMEALGLAVTRLIRIAYGPFQLGHLEPGEVEEVRGTVLRDQVGSWLREHDAAVTGEPAAARRAAPRQTLTLGPAPKPQRPARPG